MEGYEMNISKVFILLLSVGVYGCSSASTKNTPVNPSANNDGGTFYISGILPENTEPLIYGIYISSECSDEQLGFIGGLGSGKFTKIIKAGYQSYKPDITFNKDTGVFSTQLPKDGGSHCQWALGDVIVGLKTNEIYNEKNQPATIRLNVKAYGNSQYSIKKAKEDRRKIVTGDLLVNTTYYLSIEHRFNNKKIIKLIDDSHYGVKYALINNGIDSHVDFSPKLDLSYATHFYEKMSAETNKPTFSRVYPNGQVDNGKDAIDVRPYKFYEKDSK
jgi:hypothetical protein